MKGRVPSGAGLASGTLALAGAGKLSLDELLHQRFGGGRLALLSAVVTATATALVLRRRQAALAEQIATTAPMAGTDNVTTRPTTPPRAGRTDHAPDPARGNRTSRQRARRNLKPSPQGQLPPGNRPGAARRTRTRDAPLRRTCGRRRLCGEGGTH